MEQLFMLCSKLNTLIIATICVMFFVTLTGAELSFIIQPNDQDVKEGEQALFVCTVNSLSRLQKVAWKQNNKIITIGDESKVPEQFSIRVDVNIHQYTLVISKTKRTHDNSEIQCCIREGENDRKCSDTARLNINQVPGKEFPECSPKTEIYRSPDPVTLTCITELTDPKVNLEWWVARKMVSSRPAREEHNQLVLRYTFDAKPEDDGKFVRCRMYSTVLAIERNCTIGPLNVQFAPNVTIQAPTEISVGREAVFICSGIAKPRARKYDWKLDGNPSPDEYRIESSGFVLRIFKPEKFNKTSIQCSVSNSEGTRSAKFVINVKPRKQTSYFPSQNLTRRVVSPDAMSQSSNPDEMTIAMILAITGSCSFVIVLLMLIPLCMVRLFSQKVTMDASGRIIAQPDVYFEPKDTILTNEPSLHDTVTWRRNVGIQVPVDLECGSESMYAEVETEIYTKNLSNGSIYVAKSTHV
ncbi:nephrin-like [Anneissia japonica]|uniref:nephrin-like n=1 Tax=Anneissia japonica TaxID=1529436 RepID=UPI001425AE7A|nr:nephrin-like [Anneissia japonica]